VLVSLAFFEKEGSIEPKTVVLPIVVIIAYFLRENHVDLGIGVSAEPTSVLAQRHRGKRKKQISNTNRKTCQLLMSFHEIFSLNYVSNTAVIESLTFYFIDFSYFRLQRLQTFSKATQTPANGSLQTNPSMNSDPSITHSPPIASIK